MNVVFISFINGISLLLLLFFVSGVLKILNVWDDDDSIVCRSPLPTIPEPRSKRKQKQIERCRKKKVFLGPDPGFLFSFVTTYTAEIKKKHGRRYCDSSIGHTSYAVHMPVSS